MRYKLYTTRGKTDVDYICRYETLAKDLEVVREKLGLPEPLTLLKAKFGHRKQKRHYQDFFNDQQRERVAEIFADEIKLIGYTY